MSKKLTKFSGSRDALLASSGRLLRAPGEPSIKAKPLCRLIHWMLERHAVHVRREVLKLDPPWTADKVIRSNFFTNPFRENDRTTIWLRENIRDPLAEDDDVLFAVLLFRWFNSIPTGQWLMDVPLKPPSQGGEVGMRSGDSLFWFRPDWTKRSDRIASLKRALDNRQADGHALFGGAYIIKLENGKRKHHSVIDTISSVWRAEGLDLLEHARDCPTLELLHKRLVLIPWLGPFMAYEVVTDLRHTWIGRQAHDICSWANPGPGAFRGLRRLLGMSVDRRQDKSVPGGHRGAVDLMRRLLEILREELPMRWREYAASAWMLKPAGPPTVAPALQTLPASEYGLTLPKSVRELPPIEMREVEHSLCEFDKYERARTGHGGRMKRKFTKGG